MNSPATRSTTLRREEEGGFVLFDVDHLNRWVTSKVFGCGVALPLRRAFDADRCRTRRKLSL